MARPTKDNPGVWGDYFATDEDDDEHQIVESEDQGLRVRVGVVFNGNKTVSEPGIWINYQEKHMVSKMQGPLLLSPKTWRELNRLVEEGLRRKSSS